MPPGLFGNLSLKSEVLEKLEEISSQKLLDSQQIELAGLIRSSKRTDLLTPALKYAAKIDKASDILIAEVLHVLVDQSLSIAIRSLAAGVLGHLIPRRSAKGCSDFDLSMVVESMCHVLRRSESPALNKSLFVALGQIRAKGR